MLRLGVGGFGGGDVGGGLVGEDVREAAGRDGVPHEVVEPVQQRGPAVVGPAQLLRALAEGLDALLEDGFEQGLPGGEVPAHGGGADARGAGDLFEGGGGTVPGDLGLGHGQDAAVVAAGVRALTGHVLSFSPC